MSDRIPDEIVERHAKTIHAREVFRPWGQSSEMLRAQYLRDARRELKAVYADIKAVALREAADRFADEWSGRRDAQALLRARADRIGGQP